MGLSIASAAQSRESIDQWLNEAHVDRELSVAALRLDRLALPLRRQLHVRVGDLARRALPFPFDQAFTMSASMSRCTSSTGQGCGVPSNRGAGRTSCMAFIPSTILSGVRGI
jgi:hypothetical protein